MKVLIYIAVIVGAYMLGNVNNAVIISKLKGKDIRTLGSGNPGTMNMRRNFGFKIAFLTMVLDALKGFLPSILGQWIIGRWVLNERFSYFNNNIGTYIGALAAIIGHIFPVMYKFKGGKGIASSIGVGFAFHPVVALISFVVGFTFMTFTSMGSVTSFIVITPAFIYELFKLYGSGQIAAQILVFSLFFLTLFCHRKNLVKLFAGTESKTQVLNKGKKKEKAV